MFTGFFTTGLKIIAGTWDCTNGGPVIYRGTPTSAIIDVTDSSQDGSGAQTSDASNDMWIWNNEETNFDDVSVNGRVSRVMVFNADLSLGDIRLQQWNPHNTSNCVLWVEYGYNGVGTQIDLSGNQNDGTLTGLTQADHYPGRPPFGFHDEIVFPVATGRKRTIRIQ